jgi:hypothetical protein
MQYAYERESTLKSYSYKKCIKFCIKCFLIATAAAYAAVLFFSFEKAVF